MDKKILALSLIAAGNVFGMNDQVIENSYPGIQYNPGSVGYVVEHESFIEIYKMVYDATVLARNGQLSDQDILDLVQNIFSIESINSGKNIFWTDAWHQAEFDANHKVEMSDENIRNVYDFSKKLYETIEQFKKKYYNFK